MSIQIYYAVNLKPAIGNIQLAIILSHDDPIIAIALFQLPIFNIVSK
jgi:hypothetical protein